MKSWNIQKAVYQRLRGFSALSTLLAEDVTDSNSPKGSAVYDHVPQNAIYPYVAFGDETVQAWDTDTETGNESTLTLHVWSRTRGKRETKLIIDQLYEALHRLDLTIEDLQTIAVEFDFADNFLDADGLTRHGVIRFRFITEE